MNSLEGRTVVLADDDRDLLDALALRMRALGIGVYAAQDAFSALSLIRSRQPDLVCLDVAMPAGDGLSVCEMLASDSEYSSIPVIILTGESSATTIRRCHALCAYYVEKCPDVWPRIAPLLDELLELKTTTDNVL